MAWIEYCNGEPKGGEKRLIDELLKLPDNYGIFSNYRIEGGRDPLEMDAIVLAPHAIYVIENKDWHGEITADSTGWRLDGKQRDNVMNKIAHKAVVLKSKIESYYSGFKDISVQSCVSLSAITKPDITGLNIPRKNYVLMLDKIVDFIRDPEQLENPRDSKLPGRYQAMLRRAFIKGLDSLKGTQIHSPLGKNYLVERIAYPHNRYVPYLVRDDNTQIILKCYDLPKDLRSGELEGYIREHSKVVERYHDVLLHLQEEPRDDGAQYIEIGDASFLDKDRRLYIVPTRWQSGAWSVLSAKKQDMHLMMRLEIALRACQGLEYAHRQGIVHRNLSTDCILVSYSGEVRIIDWDFAIFWDEKNRRQVPGTTYLPQNSPEEMQGDLRRSERFQSPELRNPENPIQQVSPESDLYSLGVVLYELFAKRDFTGELSQVKPVLLGSGLMEEISEHILSFCDPQPENRRREILPELIKLLEEQAEQKYLPRLSRKYIWSIKDMQFINARDRHETRVSISYRMDQVKPVNRSVIVKFLKTDSASDASGEQADIKALLDKLGTQYTAAWIFGGRIQVSETGAFVWDSQPDNAVQRYYQIFEYIEGSRLDVAINSGEFEDAETALRLAMQILMALQTVHKAGWVHYDVKPDNFILLPNWREMLKDPSSPQAVKIIDFGSAHPIDRENPRKSLSPGFKPMDAYEVRGDEKYQTDLNSAALVIVSMLCGLNHAQNYSPNLDLDLLKGKVGERVFSLLQNMTLPKRPEWKYKTIPQFASELKKALEGPVPQVDDTVEGSSGDLQKYNEIRRYISDRYEEVINPISARLKKEGFEEVIADSLYFNETADDALKKALSQIESLNQIKDELTDKDIDLGIDVSQLEREWKLVDLKRRLAWAIDRKENEELTTAIEDARKYSVEVGEKADAVVTKLLAQAIQRRTLLASEHLTIATSAQKTDQLNDLVAHLSDTEMPLSDIGEFQKVFQAIIENTQKFERLGIEYIQDEQTVDKYRKLDTTEQQRSSIRASAKNAIKGFKEKAETYSSVSPLVARQWFEAVKLLRGFLHEKEDASDLKELDELNKKIEGNCARWSKAQESLEQAEEKRTRAKDDKSYWDACGDVRNAFKAYPDHTGIGEALRACVVAISEYIRRDMAKLRRKRETELPVIEAGLLAADWRNGRLFRFDVQPWLGEVQQQIQQERQTVERLEDRFRRAFGDDLFEKERSVILAEIENVRKNNLKSKEWIEDQIAKRRKIRADIQQIQLELDKTSVSAAQSIYDELRKNNSEWVDDVEVRQIGFLIAENLNNPERIRLARLAFAAQDWESCIAYCESVEGAADRVTLPEVVDEGYRLQYLSESSAGIPGDDFAQFVPIMKQLAMVYQAGRKLEAIWSREDYVEAKECFEQIIKFGVGRSPLVAGEKSRISFDEKVGEYERREKFGNENYIAGSTLTALIEQYHTGFENQRESAAPTPSWIATTRDALNDLLEFDRDHQTLWVGKRRVWQDELVALLLKHFTNWISKLQSLPSVTVDQLELSLSCLRVVRRAGRLQNLDSQYRRWVVLQYYGMRAREVGDDHQRIVTLWRDAVSDLSDDSVVLEEYKNARLNGWISMLDSALNDLARDAGTYQAFSDLLNRQESAAPHLFAPIMDAESQEIFVPCDETRDIELRRELGRRMMEVEAVLAREPGRLPLVLRDLKQSADERGKKILESKAEFLAQRFVDEKIRLGENYLLANNRDVKLAGKYFVEAFQLAPDLSRCKECIRANSTAVQEYWHWLDQQIAELDHRLGNIYSQLRLANQLEIELTALEKVNDSKLVRFSRIDKEELNAARLDLNKKRNVLEAGKVLLDWHFSPASEGWQKAVRPGGRKENYDSAWRQLYAHLSKLEREFTREHEQVSGIRLGISRLESIKTLSGYYELMFEKLESNTDDYSLAGLLKTCREVNDLAHNLWVWEPEYHAQWMEWEGGRSYPVYFLNEFSAYEKWVFKFPGVGGKEEYAYYQHDSQRFGSWVIWLDEFVTRKASGSGQDKLQKYSYEFDEKRWQSFWGDRSDVENTLVSDSQAGQLCLGTYLMLALKTSRAWHIAAAEAQQKDDDFTKLWAELKLQNPTWKTREYIRIVRSPHLDGWIEHLILKSAPAEPCLTRYSNNERRRIREFIKNARVLSEELKSKIEMLDQEEEHWLDEFDRWFGYDNPPSVGALPAQTQSLERQQLFYNEEQFRTAVSTHAEKLGILFHEVEKRYVAEIQPRHIFYSHGLDVIREG